jgi:hypothetical protein
MKCVPKCVPNHFLMIPMTYVYIYLQGTHY